MNEFELAQLNIAAMREPLESPSMADFVANLERINALAEQSAGFVWRLEDDAGDATSLRPFGDLVIVNMSVWTDVDSLRRFAFESAHVEIFRRRREWFDRMSDASSVLWWVRRGHRPTLDEAAERLDFLRAKGATVRAFTFKDTFLPPQPAETQAAP
jgi:Domain of unknown function (DUF3291)